MTDRHHYNPYTVTSGSNVFVGNIAQAAYDVIDRIAHEHDTSRSMVARAVLENVAQAEPDRVSEIIKAKLGEPKRKARRVKYATARYKPKIEIEREIRSQDRVCSEINGCVPPGGCRYPYCECKV